MTFSDLQPLLVVCADPQTSQELLARLHDAGAQVVGHAPTAALALTLTAQTAPRAVILSGRPAGRRDERELAEALRSLWGVGCYVVDDEPPDGEAGASGRIRLRPFDFLEAA